MDESGTVLNDAGKRLSDSGRIGDGAMRAGLAKGNGAVMMALALAKRDRSNILRPLKVLIPLIQADLANGDRAGMEYYADAGDKLLEAQKQVAYGRFGAWLSKNFALKRDMAYKYMRLAKWRDDNSKLSAGGL